MKQKFLQDEKMDLLSDDLKNDSIENVIYEPVNSNVNSYDIINKINASKKKNNDDNDEDIDDDLNDDDEEEKEEIENPFDREPTDKEIIENDLPFENPEDDLLDDEKEIPYN